MSHQHIKLRISHCRGPACLHDSKELSWESGTPIRRRPSSPVYRSPHFWGWLFYSLGSYLFSASPPPIIMEGFDLVHYYISRACTVHSRCAINRCWLKEWDSEGPLSRASSVAVLIGSTWWTLALACSTWVLLADCLCRHGIAQDDPFRKETLPRLCFRQGPRGSPMVDWLVSTLLATKFNLLVQAFRMCLLYTEHSWDHIHILTDTRIRSLSFCEVLTQN